MADVAGTMPRVPEQARVLGAEFLGTFWLVLMGCGAAVISSGFGPGAIGILGVALAFGLTVLTMAYAVGGISGGHFNPAVTIGLWVAGRCRSRDVVPYVVTQVVAGVAAATVLYLIASGRPGFSASGSGFAANGYGAHSPGRYGLGSALVVEILMTGLFVAVILGATSQLASPKGFAPLAIGLALTVIHLATIPVTNTSVNPARSTGPALFVGGWALSQLWLFWVAPIAGAAIAGGLYKVFGSTESVVVPESGAAAAAAAGVVAPRRPPRGANSRRR